MTIKSLSGIKPPIGTTIETYSDRVYVAGEQVQLQNRFGDLIGLLKCLGPHKAVEVKNVGGYTTDVARGCYKFEVVS